MPRAIDGNGLIFFGECDFRPDGSYITTCFFTLLGMPLLPLYSTRKWGMTSDNRSVDDKAQKVPMKWVQVFRIYAYILLFPITIFAMIFTHVMTHAHAAMVWRFFGWLFVIFAPILLFLLPTLLRIRAARKVGLDKKLTVSKPMKWALAILSSIFMILMVIR